MRAKILIVKVVWFVLVGVLFGGAPPSSWAQAPGIYADFSTSMGLFTCQLDYQHAPKAVANFVGLATGQRAWVDESNGQIRTAAFYDGLIFHRVIAEFVIQSGSPNGLGTDGPGYAFPDEFDPSVRHDGPGVLSSANSGTNSNGAQFFVTTQATPRLNDVHTIFGRVVVGQEVVDAINQAPTDSMDKPVTPITINSVTIRRVGAAAQAFDIDAQSLPVVSSVPLKLGAGMDQVTLSFSNSQYSADRLLNSTNLTLWKMSDLGIRLAPSAPDSITLPMEGPEGFFSLTRVQYPSSTWAPLALTNRTLILNFNEGQNIMTIHFDGANGGDYTFPPLAPGTVLAYLWTQEPYRGFLSPILFSGVVRMSLRLDFRAELAGVFSGTAYASPPFSVSGTFTLSPP